MENKVFVLTGVTSGIGKALAFDIAKTGEALVMLLAMPSADRLFQKKSNHGGRTRTLT